MKLHVIFLILCIREVLSMCEIRSNCSNTRPCCLQGGENLRKLPEVKSKNGKLDIYLSVQIADVQFEWLSVRRRTYNGSVTGPIWRINPGDNVTVTLDNTLSPNQDEGEPNTFRLPNTTNLHTHGLHISSKTPQDNVFIHVDPGTSFTYKYEIVESNSPGTYWYHAHVHGSTHFQVQSGLSGILIIDDPPVIPAAPLLAAVSCPNYCQHEVPLIFQSLLQFTGTSGFICSQKTIKDPFRNTEIVEGTVDTLEKWLSNTTKGNFNYITTNGQYKPKLDIETGQVKRFRMVNSAATDILELSITDPGFQTATAGCEVNEIAYDGIYLDKARPPRFGKSLIPPGGKVDWLVVCNNPGTYELRSTPDPLGKASIGGFSRYNDSLLTIEVAGPSPGSVMTILQSSVPRRPRTDTGFMNCSDKDVHGRFVVEIADGLHLNREHLNGSSNPRFKTELDTVQEWYLISTSTQSGHPIHIHVNNFQIISYNKYTGPISVSEGGNLIFYSQEGKRCYHQSEGYNSTGPQGDPPSPPFTYEDHDQKWEHEFNSNPATIGYVAAGDFRDTLLVPPLSNITIRFRNDMFTGTVVMHCHILRHEDSGMMMTTEIVKQGEDLTAAVESGGASPGQCHKCDPFPFNEDTSKCLQRLALIYLLLLLLLLLIPIAIAIWCCWNHHRPRPQRSEQVAYSTGTTNL